MQTNDAYSDPSVSEIVARLVRLREDIDAIDHHQVNRLLQEVNDIIQLVSNINTAAA